MASCLLMLPSLTFYAPVWHLCIITHSLSITFSILSVYRVLSGNFTCFVVFSVWLLSTWTHHSLPQGISCICIFLQSTLSLYHIPFIFSSSLSYIIHASASYSGNKTFACVPSHSELPVHWTYRQIFVPGPKEAETALSDCRWGATTMQPLWLYPSIFVIHFPSSQTKRSWSKAPLMEVSSNTQLHIQLSKCWTFINHEAPIKRRKELLNKKDACSLYVHHFQTKTSKWSRWNCCFQINTWKMGWWRKEKVKQHNPNNF